MDFSPDSVFPTGERPGRPDAAIAKIVSTMELVKELCDEAALHAHCEFFWVFMAKRGQEVTKWEVQPDDGAKIAVVVLEELRKVPWCGRRHPRRRSKRNTDGVQMRRLFCFQF